MFKRLISLILFAGLHFSIPSKAAEMVGSYNDFVQFKNRPLLVVLPVPFSKNDLATIDSLNQLFVKDIEQVWETKQEIHFITYPEFLDMKKSKDESLKSKYAVLQFQLWQVRSGSSLFYRSNLNVGLSEKLLKNTFTYYHYFMNGYPSENEFLSSLMQAQSYMNKCLKRKQLISLKDEVKENNVKLKDMTLLLDKKLLVKGLNEQEISKTYNMPFKIVDSKVIENAIRNKTPKCAYIDMQSASLRDFSNVAQYVLDTDNGEVMGYSFRSVYKLRGNQDKIQAINLKDYIKYID